MYSNTDQVPLPSISSKTCRNMWNLQPNSWADQCAIYQRYAIPGYDLPMRQELTFGDFKVKTQKMW